MNDKREGEPGLPGELGTRGGVGGKGGRGGQGGTAGGDGIRYLQLAYLAALAVVAILFASWWIHSTRRIDRNTQLIARTQNTQCLSLAVTRDNQRYVLQTLILYGNVLSDRTQVGLRPVPPATIQELYRRLRMLTVPTCKGDRP